MNEGSESGPAPMFRQPSRGLKKPACRSHTLEVIVQRDVAAETSGLVRFDPLTPLRPCRGRLTTNRAMPSGALPSGLHTRAAALKTTQGDRPIRELSQAWVKRSRVAERARDP